MKLLRSLLTFAFCFAQRASAIALFGLALIIASPTGAAPLNATIQDVSSEFPNRQAVHCVDGSGLDASNPPNHDTTPTDMWMNRGDGTFTGTADPDRPGQLGHITFNLGGLFGLNSFRVWNYNENTSFNFSNRGIKTLTISVSTDGTTFTPLINPATSTTTWTFAQAPGSSSYTGQLFTFSSPVLAAYVRFDIKTNYDPEPNNGNPSLGFAGLSEIRFDGSTPFVVTNTADSGAGSLRQAILDANAVPGGDAIRFNIPAATDPGCNAGTGVCTITPATPLPAITDPVSIDGYTQPGASVNTGAFGAADNAVLLIELNGTSAGASNFSDFSHSGLALNAGGGGSTIRGLVINRFADAGIVMNSISASSTANGNFITGNFIGTDTTGASPLPNQWGIIINDSSNNTIGGGTPAVRNILSGNINTASPSFGAFGDRATVGITGSAGPTGNAISGNYIGTDATGTTAVDTVHVNARGVVIKGNATGNTIGGATAALGNVISGLRFAAVEFNSVNASATTVQNNLMGTKADGTGPLTSGTMNFGIIGGGASNSNIITGNTLKNLTQISIELQGTGNAVTSNTISDNQRQCVSLTGDSSNVSSNNCTNNGSAGNEPGGIAVNGSSNTVSNNSITNNNALGLSIAGSNNSITGNTITGTIADPDIGEPGNGIAVSGTGNSILGNSIYSNAGLGIDLNDDGVTTNDARDPDSGPNNLQNFPIITSISTGGNTTTIQGKLNSNPGNTYRIQFFSNPTCSVSGNGEGKTFIGEINPTGPTDANGDLSFTFTTASGTTVPTGYVVTSTATVVAANATGTAVGDTSEFSPCAPGNFIVTNTNDSGAGSLRAAIIAANANPGADIISFNISGAGVHTITPLSPLPAITDPVTIDGYTQPGASANTGAFGAADNAVLKIELDGENAGSSSLGDFTNSGLKIDAGGGGSTIKGLVINRFGDAGIVVNSAAASTTAGGNFITGNFIGTDSTGANPIGTQTQAVGVAINDSAGNTIGGTTPAARNVISGNTDLPNQQSGRMAQIAITNKFGGGAANNNVIIGNYIGTNAAGTGAIDNTSFIQAGILLDTTAGGNTVGGTASGAGNVISGIFGAAIQMSDGSNTIQGNLIGTTADGTGALGNKAGGIRDAGSGSSNNLIGGATAAAGNTIKNTTGGLTIFLNSGSNSNTISGNTIASNQRQAVSISGDNNIVSGNITTNNGSSVNRTGAISVSGNGNSVSNNTVTNSNLYGIRFTGTNNTISGNTITGSITQDQSFPGARGEGIFSQGTFGAGTTNNSITGNTIHDNGGPGIEVFIQTTVSTATGNSISGNSIYNNGALGIDLVTCDSLNSNCSIGLTPNDAGDGDTGPNNYQNFPVITSVQTVSGSTTITGNFNSTPNHTFRIEFFTNASCDTNTSGVSSGTNGEGEIAIDVLDPVTTDVNGNANFSFTAATAITPGRAVTATATDKTTHDTSEFSACAPATAPPPANISGTITYNGNGLSGVTVDLTGTQSGTTSTDANGQYSFTSLPAGTYTVTPTKTHFTFSPTSRNVNLSGTDQTADFTASTPPPQTRTVTDSGDSGANTLRQAIADANPGDTINFNLGSGPQTITLGSQLTISTDLTITGPGACLLTISGNNVTRVFEIANATNVTISGLTITNGFASGANGGGIQSFGTLTLNECIISNNVADSGGGGVFITDGAATINGCTFTGNNTGAGFGGAPGGGLYVNGGAAITVDVNNCTFNGNSAFQGGAVAPFAGTVNLKSATIVGNSAATSGGGVRSGGTVTINNSIVSNNTPDNTSSFGGSVTGSYNFIGFDPQLGPLQDNGGCVPTMAPQPDSPVIDQGNAFGLTTDQRGLTRPVRFSDLIAPATGGDFSDIGAVELAAPICTPPPGGMVGWWPGDGNHHDIVNGNDGAPEGNEAFVTGEVGQAFNFDGTGPENMGTPAALDITGDKITLDGWVNLSATTGQAVFFGKTSSGSNDYALFMLSNQLAACIRTADGTEHFLYTDVNPNYPTGFVPPNGQWVHIALVYDGSNEIIYVNGAEFVREAVSGNIASEGVPFFIGGRDSDFPSYNLNGKVDEVEVFNVALGATDIQAIYNAGPGGKCKACLTPPPGMIAWWPGQNHANDIVGSHHATLEGGASYTTGHVGQAFSFNGTDADVRIPASSDWNFGTGDFTFDFWALGNGTSRMHALSFEPDPTFSGTAAQGNLDFDFNDNSSGLEVFWNGGGGNSIEVGLVGQYTQGNYHHYALTRTGTTITLYIDGVLAGTASYPAPIDLSGGTNNYLGASTGLVTAGNRFFWNGQIDEVEIFSRGLGPDEVQAIFAAGVHAPISATDFSNVGKCVPPPVVQLSSATYSVNETDSTVPITITRTGDSSVSSTVHYATSDGTGMAGQDYTATSGNVTFAAGEVTPKVINVPIIDDNVHGPDETFNFTLSSPSVGTTLGVASAVVTILEGADIDPAPSVTNTNDSGPGSLREAIADALNGDTINFNIPGAGAHTITLASGLVINTDITINGPGSVLLTVQRDSGAATDFAVFENAATATISGLTISGGTASGVSNDVGATLTLTNVTISGNSASSGGGIFNNASATLTLANCTVSGNTASASGGGIYNSGTLSIAQSTLSGNSASNNPGALGGGAIDNENGTLNLLNSTLSGNSARLGGAIASRGTLTAINTTISGNSSGAGGGGILNDVGPAILTNVTVFNNQSGAAGGGIFSASGGTLTLRNTIVAGNLRNSSQSDVAGSIESSSFNNLIGVDTNMTGISNGTNGNHVGTGAAPINARLAALANYGGPTKTHLPLPPSPAINAGANVTTLDGAVDNAVTTVTVIDGSSIPLVAPGFLIQIDSEQMLVTGISGNSLTVTRGANSTTAAAHINGAAVNSAFDQRGSPRKVNGSLDIGAVEVNTTTGVTSSLNPSAFGQSVTFTATVTPASGSGPTGTVQFVIDGSNFGSPVTLSGGTAQTSTSSLSVSGSPHTVSATYSGDGTFDNSSGSLSGGQTVNKADTTTGVTSSLNPSAFGQSVTFTATVTPASGSGPTGTVAFKDGATTIGTGTLNGSGVATFATSSLPVGTHTITAAYPGDGSFNGSNGSLSGGQTVNKADTTTGVTSSLNPSKFGQNVTFTATVTPASGSGPSGTVQFVIDGSNFGSPVTLSSGTAQTSTATLSVSGTAHTVSATYSGDGNFNGSNGSLSGGQVVNKADTTTGVTSSLNPSVFGQNVTFTATVTPASGSGLTGTVQFVIDGSNFGSPVTLSGGTAQTSISSLSVSGSPHTVSATYSGDGSFSGSNGSLSGGQTVNKASTTTGVTSSLNPSTFGQSVTFTATVTPASGSGPSGTVQFVIDGNNFGSAVTLSGGTAQISTSSLGASGTAHTVSATYSGDGSFNGSNGSLSGGQTVNKANSTTGVTSSLNPSAFGQSVTFTATITPASGSGPSGTVQFVIDGSNFGSPVTVSGGTAQVSTSTLSVSGTAHTVSATYSGDGNFNGSNGSLAGGQVVNKANTTTALTSSPNPSSNGQSVTFTATVTPSSGSGPTGTVTFKDGSTTLGTGTLNGSGVATFSTSSLTPGTHTITATYNGDGNFNTSNGTLSGGQNVNAPTPTPTATATATPTIPPSPTPSPTPKGADAAQALNISTRLRVDTGDKAMIAGFIITGNVPKAVALRGIGPSLAAFGLTDLLLDPVLELHGSNGSLIMRNDNWKDDQRSQIEGGPFQPSDDRESVILATLPPAAYTAILTGKNNTTGIGVVEVYDNNQAADSQLANISTRGFVLNGNNVMIGGFILGGGSNNSRIALRGIGPSLAQFGLNPVLADPTLELHNANGTTLIANDNWTDDPVSAALLTANGLAPSDPKESGIFTALPAGQFTAILTGKNGGTGIGLIEAYNLK